MDESERWCELAAEALKQLWGASLAATVAATFRAEGRNRVYRLVLEGAPVASVIMKASVGERDSERLSNEWAGSAMLAPLGLGPVAYVGDTEHRFVVLEDLGQGESLADRLTGDDPEAAEAALFAYARSLGELHTATQGQAKRWQALRTERGGTEQPHELGGFRRELAPFVALCKREGLTVPEAELSQIEAVVENPGDYLAFSPTDCCPDNHFLRAERVVFFDNEGARMRHALLDAAYLLAPFPTCWCIGRLPDGLPETLLSAYREHFPGDERFDEQLTLILAGWVLQTLSWGWNGNWEEEDRTWGLATLRQRHLYRLENLLARPNLSTLLPGVARAVGGLYGILKVRWEGLEPIPLYPAFRGEASKT